MLTEQVMQNCANLPEASGPEFGRTHQHPPQAQALGSRFFSSATSLPDRLITELFFLLVLSKNGY
jgi:hypothetical protein